MGVFSELLVLKMASAADEHASDHSSDDNLDELDDNDEINQLTSEVSSDTEEAYLHSEVKTNEFCKFMCTSQAQLFSRNIL